MSATTAAEPICTSEVCRLSRSRFLRTLTMQKALWPLLMMALAMVGTMLLGVFIDTRWLIVALMIPAILLPMVMFFLYAAYALSPRCLPCVHPHRVTAYSDRLSIDYEVTIPPLGEEGEAELRTVHLDVPAEQITACKPGLNDLLILMEKPFGFLRLPYASLSDADALIRMLQESQIHRT